MIERALILSCARWLHDSLGVDPPSAETLAGLSVRLPEPDAVVAMDEAEYVPIGRARWLRAGVHALVLGLLLGLLAALLGLGLGAGLWLGLLAAPLVYPVALAVDPEPLDLDPEDDPAPAVIRALVLERLNRNPVRRFLHVALDCLLFFLLLSWQEGLAAWAARAHCRDLGLDCLPVGGWRGRLSAWLPGLTARLLGPRAVGALIRLA